jgi:hypothetical protein
VLSWSIDASRRQTCSGYRILSIWPPCMNDSLSFRSNMYASQPTYKQPTTNQRNEVGKTNVAGSDARETSTVGTLKNTFIASKRSSLEMFMSDTRAERDAITPTEGLNTQIYIHTHFVKRHVQGEVPNETKFWCVRVLAARGSPRFRSRTDALLLPARSLATESSRASITAVGVSCHTHTHQSSQPVKSKQNRRERTLNSPTAGLRTC